jgi:Toastrack DUF4097
MNVEMVRVDPRAAAVALVFALFPAAAGAQVVEGSFQRALTVSGQADIDIVTGSGRIEVRQGASGRVEISGQVRASSNWGWNNRSRLSPEERVRRIEANPPVQQTGSVIRIGRIEDDDLRDGVSISYTVTVPAESTLQSKTGSGSQRIEGVHGRVQTSTGSGSIVVLDVGSLSATTGSGSITIDGVDGPLYAATGSGGIHATGVKGAITAKTGSGGIEAVQTGDGEVEVSSSSGTVRVRGIRGPLRASTTSGGLHVEGEPKGDWRLSSSSGSVHIDVPTGSGFELDANSSSGRVNVGMPISVVGWSGKHSLRGSVGGGGPRMHVRTSSGGIQIN